MKHVCCILLAGLSLLLCTACEDGSAAESPPSQAVSSEVSPEPAAPPTAVNTPTYPPTTEDLGEGYTLVTDYDLQGRKLQETTLYSGERYPDRMLMDIDPETGKLIPAGSVTPEIVENMVVNRTVYDYDGEGYAIQIRNYPYNAPDPDIPNMIRQEDAEGRIVMYEGHNFHLDWGITEDYYRYTLHYEEDTSNVTVTVYTSFMPDNLPGTEPVTDTVQCTVPMNPSAYGLSPGGLSYGREGVVNFSLCEVDKEGKSLRVCTYDREGNLTDSYEAPPEEPLETSS